MLFAEVIPASLAPFLGNGIATGGLAAVLLAAIFRYYPGAAASMTLDLEPSQLPRLTARIAELERSIGLAPRAVPLVQLVCEELFVALCDRRAEAPGTPARFSWTNTDEGVQVEVETQVDLAIEAGAERVELTGADLDRLGLLIVARVARNVRSARIDGHSFVQVTLREV